MKYLVTFTKKCVIETIKVNCAVNTGLMMVLTAYLVKTLLMQELMFLPGKTKGSAAHCTGYTARLVSCRRAPPSVHQQHLAISDTLGGEAEQTVSCCRIHLARKRGEGEGFFPSLVSQRLYRSPLTALGSPRKGCAVVCRMSRHEGELINRSTAPGLVATLPEQLAPLASFAKCLFESGGSVAFFAACFQTCPDIRAFPICSSGVHISLVSINLRQNVEASLNLLAMIRQHCGA